LTIGNPIDRKQFSDIVQQIQNDPLGTYGRVLLNAPHFSITPTSHINRFAPNDFTRTSTDSRQLSRQPLATRKNRNLLAALKNSAGKETATNFQRLLDNFTPIRVTAADAALLIIDPQRSFTRGVWMQSIGADAAIDVEPIAIAFNNCCKLLKYVYGQMEIMFSRCPFPPGSYDWDDKLSDIIDSQQRYFIKPGNSVLFPPLNGFREWVTFCIDQGIRTLVIGGCTLNSCVRVSSIETQRIFGGKHFQVVADLSICGARLRNYKSSNLYSGVSAVASAISQMTAAGVQVAQRVDFR
jgi:hypothetical protein